MSSKVTSHHSFSYVELLTCLLLASLLSACKPDGLINKVKYRGEKYINTCETFNAAVTKVIQNNNDPHRLRVSQYDNSDFSYYYLEQGQFEVKNDSLYFRLAQDFEYPQYLDKGVAIHVNASYRAVENISDLEPEPAGNIGTLVVDRAYYIANRKPFFLYKFPLNGKSIEGKQLLLAFAIAKYDKSGNLKQFFCETDATPIGTAMPACCTAVPWENTHLQSIVDFPEIKVNDEQFKYSGFTGTIDVIFKEGSFSLKDDSAFSTTLIQAFVKKYQNLGYEITRIDLKGYASPGGKEKLNQQLSEKRATSMKEGLEALNGENSGLSITATGMGEDWDRVKLLTQVSSLNKDQQDQVLAIANDGSLTNDQKEAKMRLVKFWDTLVEEVLIKARHTMATMDFEYRGSEPTLERYADQLPVASPGLEQVARTTVGVSGYKAGKDPVEGLATVNELLTKKATPNLYAMRASYYLAQEEYGKAIEDLEKAARFRGTEAKSFALAAQGYKVIFADQNSFEEKKAMYKEFSELSKSNPGDRKLFFNRAVLMDKIGFISGALGEYKNLFAGSTPSAANLNNRGVARLKTNMLTEAQSDFAAAVGSDGQLAESYYNLATISAYKGFTKQTIEYLDKAIAIDPSLKSNIFNNPVFSVMSEDPRFDKYR